MWLNISPAPPLEPGSVAGETRNGMTSGKSVTGENQSSKVVCAAGFTATGVNEARTNMAKFVTSRVFEQRPWLSDTPKPASFTVSSPYTGKFARPQKPLPDRDQVVGAVPTSISRPAP